MNRRDFFGAMGAASATALIGTQGVPEPEVRRVMFNPPREAPAIYWMHGHVSLNKFMLFFDLIEMSVPVAPAYVKHGWGTHKLDRISIYLSDRPLENFEPITYWIRTDQEATP